MDNHKIEIVPLVREKHPYADLLSIVRVGGYVCIIKTTDWEGIDKAAFIPPDSLVPVNRPEFSWLKETTNTLYNKDCQKWVSPSEEPYFRVTVRRFRKIMSYGVLVPCQGEVGDDVTEALGVLHYNPPEPVDMGGNAAPGPNLYFVKYDLAGFEKYAKNFVQGELVICTEKIHGCNGRWVCSNGAIYCGSRTEWKREFDAQGKKNLWWQALDNHPEMITWLKNHPDYIVYGEVYGQVQKLRYGTKPGEVRIGVFDIMKSNWWLDHDDARKLGPELPWVPEVCRVKYDFETLKQLAEGRSLVPGADHFREGIVVSPLKERICDQIGRVKLKIVSPSYLEFC